MLTIIGYVLYWNEVILMVINEHRLSGTSAGEYQSWFGHAGTNLTFIGFSTYCIVFGDLA